MLSDEMSRHMQLIRFGIIIELLLLSSQGLIPEIFPDFSDAAVSMDRVDMHDWMQQVVNISKHVIAIALPDYGPGL